MPLLSSSAKSQLRRVSNLDLSDTCSILVPTKTNTGTGRTITYAATTGVACLRVPMRARIAQELFSKGTIKSMEAYIFHFKHDQAFESLSSEPVGSFRLQDADGTYEIVPTPQDASLRMYKQYMAYKVG